MDDLDRNIEAYNLMKENLERDHNGKWVVFFEQKLVGIFDHFENAADEAVQRFGAGPYLIRQIGAPPHTLPASIMFRRVYA